MHKRRVRPALRHRGPCETRCFRFGGPDLRLLLPVAGMLRASHPGLVPWFDSTKYKWLRIVISVPRRFWMFQRVTYMDVAKPSIESDRPGLESNSPVHRNQPAEAGVSDGK